MSDIRIFFRGRNTAAIVGDADQRGIGGAVTLIVAAADDRLAEPGDVTPEEAIRRVWLEISVRRREDRDPAEVVVIANGGTTAPALRVSLSLMRAAHDTRYLYCGGATRHEYADSLEYRSYLVVRYLDVQRDAVTSLGEI